MLLEQSISGKHLAKRKTHNTTIFITNGLRKVNFLKGKTKITSNIITALTQSKQKSKKKTFKELDKQVLDSFNKQS